MSTKAPLSCGATSITNPGGTQYQLNSCTCSFQPKPAGTFTPLGFSFSTCQNPADTYRSCCNRPQACLDVKRRRLQGFTNTVEQPILSSEYTVTQGAAIGKSGNEALLAALGELCDMDNLPDEVAE